MENTVMRRLSKIFNKVDEPKSPEEKDKKGPRISFDLVKINRHGTRQNRSLMFSEAGVSNMKGKNVQWFFPSEDIHSIEKDKYNPCKIELRVIRRYHFEANTGKEATKIIDVCRQLYNLPTPVSNNSIVTPRTTEGNALPADLVPNDKRVNIDHFELIKVLGKGSFSRVALVRKKDNKQLFAMKILLKAELKKRNQVEHTNTERQILSQYTHPFIVKLFYSFQTQDKLYMVMEYVSGGELFFHLKRARRFPENLACFYAAEVTLALEFLHSHQIVYRDLKPENIMVDSDGHLKLTDFGLSKVGITSVGGNSEGNKTRTFCGTPDYLAPEIIQGQPHGLAVDWWGLGILLYEMLTGQPPFKGQNRNELYEQTLKADVIFPEHVSPPARAIVSALLAKKPEQRLGAKGAEEVKSHPFFEKISWDKLYTKEIDPPFKPIVVENPLQVEPAIGKDKIDRDLLQPQGSFQGKASSPSFQGFSYQYDSQLSQSIDNVT